MHCKFCKINPETGYGIDIYSEIPVTSEFLGELDGQDGTPLAFIHKDKNGFCLETNEPDNEWYGRASTWTDITYCPWCGRKLEE